MIDRIKQLTNVSSAAIRVEHTGGLASIVPPGGVLKDIKIINLSEIQFQAVTIMDLSEVKEPHSKRKING